MSKFITNIKNNKLLLFYSFIEGFLLMYGIILKSNKSLSNFKLYMIIIILLFSFLFYVLNNIYFKVLSFKYKKNNEYKFSKKSLLIKWLILFILWIPVLLAYYPSIWAYDVYEQVPHLTNNVMTNKHPIIHTLLIEFILIIGKQIKDYTFGILLVTIVQMLIMSFIFAYSIEKINTKIDNKLVRYITTSILIIYYGIIPFNSIMSISITKDVLFSGILLLVIISLYDILESTYIKKSKYISFMILSVLLILFKSSASIMYIIFFLILILKKNKNKKLILFSFISIVLALSINFTLEKALNVEKRSRFEGYNIQNQNLIYTVIKHPSLDVDNSEKLYDIIPRNCFSEVLSDDYNFNRADYTKEKLIKCDIKNFDYNKYMFIWIKYGIKYPIDYIDSFSNLTIGSWFLLDESHANTYRGGSQGYLLTDYKIIKGVSDDMPDSKFPWLFKKLEKVATHNEQYNRVGIWRFIYVPSTYILSFFLILIYMKKRKYMITPLILLISFYITTLSAPVVLVRYIYPFMITIPILFIKCITLNNKREAN